MIHVRPVGSPKILKNTGHNWESLNRNNLVEPARVQSGKLPEPKTAEKWPAAISWGDPKMAGKMAGQQKNTKFWLSGHFSVIWGPPQEMAAGHFSDIFGSGPVSHSVAGQPSLNARPSPNNPPDFAILK